MGSNTVLVGGALGELHVGPLGELHHMLVRMESGRTMKVSHLRNLHEKIGFDTTSLESLAGFGYDHDGTADTLVRFGSEPLFNV